MPRGLRHYQQPGLQSYEALRAGGQQLLKQQPAVIEDEIEKGRATDIGAMFYTSGTTGNAKGVVLGYDNLIAAGRAGAEMEALSSNEEVLAYLPMAWIGQNIFSYTQWLVCGFTVNCPESAATVTADMREIGPTYYFAPPRVLEALLTQVMIRMEDASAIKRRMFHYFMRVARNVGGRLLDKQPVGVADRLLYSLGDCAGLCAAAQLAGHESRQGCIHRRRGDRARSVHVLSLARHQLEAAVWLDRNLGVRVRAGKRRRQGGHGRPAGQGSRNQADRCRRNPDSLARAVSRVLQGARGDAGSQGCRRLVSHGGRGLFRPRRSPEDHRSRKRRRQTRGRNLFAPKYIENKLKFFPTIKEAVAFGDQRPMVTAFLNIDMEAVGNWAERHNLPYAGYTDLAAKPEVLTLVREAVGKVNADLASDPALANAQIHRFIVLHKELDADDDELTRTRKVRRRFIAQKFDQLVDAMYGGLNEQYIETAVKFEDGRTGKISATLKVIDAEVFSALKKAA